LFFGGNLETKRHEHIVGSPLYWVTPKAAPTLVVHGTEDKVCSVEASKQFVEKLPASDKNISLYEGGYHELQNEPDGVKEKFVDECAAWAEAHFLTEAGDAAQAKL